MTEEKDTAKQAKPTVELQSNETQLRRALGYDQKPDWYKDPKALSIVGGIILVVIVMAAGTWAGLRKKNLASEDSRNFFENLPLSNIKDVVAPTTSGLSGRTCEDPNRRPIGVMLAGDPINRPVSGFAQADLVFELPVLVSDVTRLLAVYQCGRPGDIGSVRSARHDYLFLGEGVDAIVGHWGGSYHALNRIAAGEFQTINALTNPHNAYFRKSHLPPPYNGFTTYENLWNALQKLGYRTTTEFNAYAFKDDPPSEQRGAAGTLTVGWPGQFRVHYEYDPAANRYQRFWAGTKQLDGEDNSPVAPSVVVIMRATNQFAQGPGGYNDVAIEGEGEAAIYQDGREIKGRWRKDERYKNDPVHFLDEQGNEITFTRGQIWIMAVEPNTSVTWEPEALSTSPAQ